MDVLTSHSKTLAGLFVLVLSVNTFAIAQVGPVYALQSPTLSLYDATPDCVSKRTCWLQISTTPNLTGIFAGADVSVYALDASQNIWYLPLNSHTWQSESWSPMAELSVASTTNIYGLQTDTSVCTQPEMRVYQYTGGSNFAALSYCAVHIAAALDGTLYRIRSDGIVSHLVSGSWVSDPTAGGNGTPTKIATSGADNVWLITSTGVIKVLTSTGFVVVTGAATDIATAGHPGTATVETFIVSSSGANNVSKYSSTTDATNGTWSAMKGAALSNIAAGVHTNIMGLGSTGVYHFQNQMLVASIAMSGYYNCGYPSQCPPGSVHAAYVTGTWGSGGVNGYGNSGQSQPWQTITAGSSPLTEDCDPVFGLTTDPACKLAVLGTVQCSVMGTIAYQPLNLFFGVAETLVKQSGNPYNCSTTWLGVTNCNWPVVPNCTPGTSPPVWSPSSVWDSEPSLGAWWSIASCFRAGTGQPWTCVGISPLGAALKTPQITPGICENP